MPSYTFDPKALHVRYAGALIDGWAPGSFVEIDYNEDRYKLTVGADGLGARSKSNNESARVTLRLMPNSPSNLVFRAAQDLDKVANAGSLPLIIEDTTTGRIFESNGAWVVKDPGQKFDSETQPIEWMLETDELTTA